MNILAEILKTFWDWFMGRKKWAEIKADLEKNVMENTKQPITFKPVMIPFPQKPRKKKPNKYGDWTQRYCCMPCMRSHSREEIEKNDWICKKCGKQGKAHFKAKVVRFITRYDVNDRMSDKSAWQLKEYYDIEEKAKKKGNR